MIGGGGLIFKLAETLSLFVDNSEKVIVARPLHTMGPPFPAFEVSVFLT